MSVLMIENLTIFGVIMPFEYEKIIVETDLDMFGHVNHARYLSILEEARWAIVRELGFGMDRVISEQLGPVILGVNIQYKQELRNQDRIRIVTESSGAPSKVMQLSQVIYKSTGEVASTALVTYGLMDLRKRQLIQPPEEWINKMGLTLESKG